MSCAVALLTIPAGAATAQPVDKRTFFTFSQPVAVPGVTLPVLTTQAETTPTETKELARIAPARAKFARVNDAGGVQIELMEFGPKSLQRTAMDAWKP